MDICLTILYCRQDHRNTVACLSCSIKMNKMLILKKEKNQAEESLKVFAYTFFCFNFSSTMRGNPRGRRRFQEQWREDFVLCCVGFYPRYSRERRTAVGTNCSSLRKVFISTCHTWLPDVPKKGWEEGGRGMWRMGYILKPNNLSFVFRSIVLGRGRMGRGRNPGCFLMQPVPISWMAFLVLQPPPRKEKTLTHGQVKRDLFIFLVIFF